ncbi:MAG: hypothetical protein H7Y86_06760 [Rhizobacter sp.]|nr:hypothetical protein [Ferruginibacter sp.]
MNVWYAKDVDNDYNYADIFNNSNFPFEKLYSELNRDITGIPNVSEVVATTFFLNKILTSDSVVSLHDISAISIYLVRGGKFYHDFFLYDSAKKTFKKIDALHARIGGININTIHKLMTSVVNPKTGSSSLLIRNPRNFSKINGMTYPSNSLDELIYKYNKKYVARDEEEIGFSEATRS